MIAKELVERKYASMSDEQLMYFAMHEAEDITSDAISLLYKEFVKRRMNTEAISRLRANRIEEHIIHHEKVKEIFYKNIPGSIWRFCFNARANGLTDEYIYKTLTGSGLSEDTALGLINLIDARAKEIKDSYNFKIASGIIIALVGLALFCVIAAASFPGRPSVGAIALFIFGISRFYKGSELKGEFQKEINLLEKYHANKENESMQ